jgi:hypothetical protein
MKYFPFLLVLAQLSPSMRGIEPSEVSGELVAPPPAPPLIVVPQSETQVHGTATVYSVGDPTPEEQLHLELINRARVNPAAEALRLANVTDPQIISAYVQAGVDLNLMLQQFEVFSAVQPLAMNSRLLSAARLHSQDMFDNVFQAHDSSDGKGPGDRLMAAGYFGSAGENVYSNAESVEHGHAAFEVDWGGPGSNGGMQSPPGHRQTIHNPIFREVGIGVILGSNEMPGKTPLDHVGPQVVTQDFGVQQNSTPMITGVAYYDLNGNNFYDIGEGIGGVRVTVSGASFEAVTARSGAYAVPVPGNGSYSITFTGSNLALSSRAVTVAGSLNQKVDFTPAYNAPVLSGPAVAAIGRANAYSISPVGSASDYQWRSYQKIAAASEGAENDFTRVTATLTGVYDVIQGIRKKTGAYAFHLITPAEDPRSQYLTLSPTYLIAANSAMSFQSWLGVASTNQYARVQITTEGATWQTVYSQPGADNAAEKGWNPRSVDLAAYAGKQVRVRFAFDFTSGRYYPGNDLELGWLIDDIQFSNTQEVANEVVASATGTSLQFAPSQLGDFSLQARARTGHEFLAWGPALSVGSAVSSGAPEVRLAVTRVGGELQVDGTLIAGDAPGKVTLETRASLNEPWQVDATPVQTISPNSFRITLSTSSANNVRFYRFKIE